MRHVRNINVKSLFSCIRGSYAALARGLRHYVLTFIHSLLNITLFRVVFAMGKEGTFLTEENGIKDPFLKPLLGVFVSVDAEFSRALNAHLRDSQW